MRDKQRMVLYEMYKNVRSLHTTPITAKKISDFLRDMSEVFEKGNNGNDLLQEFLQMDIWMKSKPLPVERKEFEDRARLFCLMRDMEEFIRIKVEFAGAYFASTERPIRFSGLGCSVETVCF